MPRQQTLSIPKDYKHELTTFLRKHKFKIHSTTSKAHKDDLIDLKIIDQGRMLTFLKKKGLYTHKDASPFVAHFFNRHSALSIMTQYQVYRQMLSAGVVEKILSKFPRKTPV